MLSMILDSIRLFFTGKLFRDYGQVTRRFVFGMACGVIVLAALTYALSPIIGAIAGGAVAGFLQPYLFKDLKYR